MPIEHYHYLPRYFDEEDKQALLSRDPEELSSRTGMVNEYMPWDPRLLMSGRYSFVIMPEGSEFRFSLIPEAGGEVPMLRHHELAKGEGVVAAGMIEVRGGKIAYFSNESGHYEPEPESLLIAYSMMKRLHIPLTETVQFGIYGKKEWMSEGMWQDRKQQVVAFLQQDSRLRARRAS